MKELYHSIQDTSFKPGTISRQFKTTVRIYNLKTCVVYTGPKVASSYIREIMNKEYNIQTKYDYIFLIRNPFKRFISGIQSVLFSKPTINYILKDNYLKTYKGNLPFDWNEPSTVTTYISYTLSKFPELFIADHHTHFYHVWLWEDFLTLRKSSNSIKILDIEKDDISKEFNLTAKINVAEEKQKQSIVPGLKNIFDTKSAIIYNTPILLENYFYNKLLTHKDLL
tara:strand:- start:3486 stop:4160 length:675 start_codon:yes stop_codon:yes gene_type:complete